MYERLKSIPIGTIFEAMRQQQDHYILTHLKQEYKLKLKSLRLLTFYKHGTRCSYCGLKGKYFAVERHSKNPVSVYHLNLYGIDRQFQHILFSCDHVLARCLGGGNTLDNTVTACLPCNLEKGRRENAFKQTYRDQKDKKVMPHLQSYIVTTDPSYVKNICLELLNMGGSVENSFPSGTIIVTLFSDKVGIVETLSGVLRVSLNDSVNLIF